MRLCILKPNENAYSETFIARQIQLLEPVLVLHEGWYPTIDSKTGRSFLPFPFHFLFFRGAFRNLFPRLYHTFYSRQLKKYLIKNRIDLVLANYGPMGVSVADACRAAAIPFVVHFHGFDAHHYATLRKFSAEYPRMFDQAVAIITVSGEMKAALLRVGANENKVWHNPYAVDTEMFSPVNPAETPPVFVFVGRFTAKKDPTLLILSLGKVLEDVPEARLVLIGDGALMEPARALAKQLQITEAVEFAGAKTHAEVAAALQNARAFVQHSLTAPDGDKEGTPNTILEASSKALPVISTLHAGIKEAVIHGKTGYLVEEGDWEGMAAYMTKVAKDPELARQLGEAGRQHMLIHYSEERQKNTFYQIFESISDDI